MSVVDGAFVDDVTVVLLPITVPMTRAVSLTVLLPEAILKLDIMGFAILGVVVDEKLTAVRSVLVLFVVIELKLVSVPTERLAFTCPVTTPDASEGLSLPLVS